MNQDFQIINSVVAGQVAVEAELAPAFNASQIQSRPVATGPVSNGDTMVYDSVLGEWIYGPGGGGTLTGPTGPMSVATGPTGPMGLTLGTGPTGPGCFTGPTGPAGTGCTGPTGPAGPLVFPLTGPNLSAVTPTYSFINSTGAGMYLNGTDRVGIAADQTLIGEFVRLAGNSQFLGPGGSATRPGLSFTSNIDTGLFANVGDQIGFATNSTERMRLNNGGLRIQPAGVSAIVDASAALELSTPNQGFLPPRLAATGAITTPAPGLEIYNTTRMLPQFFDGTIWRDVGDGATGTVQFPLLAPDGTTGAPSYSFVSNPDSGIYYDPLTAGVSISNDATRIATFSTLGTDFTSPVRIPAGTVGAPGMSFVGDLDTGMFSSGTSVIDFTVNGTDRLQVSGGSVVGVRAERGTAASPGYHFFSGTTVYRAGMYLQSTGGGGLGFCSVFAPNGAGRERMRISQAGNILIQPGDQSNGGLSSDPDPAAGLEIRYTPNETFRQTFLQPRMTTAQRDMQAMGTTATGASIHNLTTNLPQFWDGAAWVDVGTGAGLTFPILAPDGTSSDPSYSFASATGTGMYLADKSVLALSSTGANVFKIMTNGDSVAGTGNATVIASLGDRSGDPNELIGVPATFTAGTFNILSVGNTGVGLTNAISVIGDSAVLNMTNTSFIGVESPLTFPTGMSIVCSDSGRVNWQSTTLIGTGATPSVDGFSYSMTGGNFLFRDEDSGVTDPIYGVKIGIAATGAGFRSAVLTTAQRDNIANGTFPEGVMIYNSDTDNYEFWDGTAWQGMSGGATALGDLTDCTTVATTGQIITIDATDRNVLMGQSAGMSLTTGTGSTYIGYQAGMSALGDNQNTYIGADAGLLSTGFENTFVGAHAGAGSSTANSNVCIGAFAGASGPSGRTLCIGRGAGRATKVPEVIFIGDNAGENHTSGVQNVCIGTRAGQDLGAAAGNTLLGHVAGTNLTGDDNVMIGRSAGSTATSATQNTIVGAFAGNMLSIGDNNTFIGRSAGGSSTTATGSVCIGSLAGQASNGDRNVLIGLEAGDDLTSGNHNVAIGARALFDPTTTSESVIVGYEAGYRLTGTQNTHVGFQAGGNQTTNLSGTANTTLGYQSGNVLTSGANNTFLGNRAGAFCTASAANTCVGSLAGDAITVGGNQNTLVGHNAGTNITTGDNNVCIGQVTGDTITIGGANTLIGQNCDVSENDFNNVVAIGTGVVASTGTSFFARNIRGITPFVDDGIPVYINSLGQLGTVGTVAAISIDDLTDAVVDGASNLFLGQGTAAVGGSDLNLIIGLNAGNVGTATLDQNIIVGHNVATALAGGQTNVIISTATAGAPAMPGLTSGTSNICIGSSDPGGALVNGNSNIFIGSTAGDTVVSGHNNVCIGNNCDCVAVGTGDSVSLGIEVQVGTTAVAVGRRARARGTNSVCIGNVTGNENDDTGHNSICIGMNAGSATGFTSAALGNVFLGISAGINVMSGANNTLVGNTAGGSVFSGDNNILIGNGADVLVSSLSNVIAIGNSFTGAGSNTCSIDNIRGVTTETAAIAVLVDSGGQLGTVSSSIRYKKDVVPLEIKTEDILALEPKHFKWKENDTVDFGLIAEETEQHVPELVVKNAEGEPETVFYRKLSTLLLKVIKDQQSQIDDLIQRVSALEN